MGKAEAQALAVAAATELSAASPEPVLALTVDLTQPGAAETVVREVPEALGASAAPPSRPGSACTASATCPPDPTRTGWPRSKMCSWPRCERVGPPCRSLSKGEAVRL